MARAGVDGASLVLRLAFGTVLIWAGFNKSCHSMPVQGEQAAVLANLGVVIKGPTTGAAPAPAPTTLPDAAPAENPPPATAPPTTPSEAPAESVEGARTEAVILTAAARTATPPTSSPPQPTSTPPAATTGATYTAADFAIATDVPRWAGLVLIMHNNQVNAQGRRIVPERIATNGSLMAWMARGAAYIELVGGFALIIGAMTRLAALLGACILGTAMWLTQLGPALGATGALLGVIPNPRMDDPALAHVAWAPLMLQLLGGASGLALAMLGAGRLSLDHFVMGSRTDDGDEYDSDEDDDD